MLFREVDTFRFAALSFQIPKASAIEVGNIPLRISVPTLRLRVQIFNGPLLHLITAGMKAIDKRNINSYLTPQPTIVNQSATAEPLSLAHLHRIQLQILITMSEPNDAVAAKTGFRNFLVSAAMKAAEERSTDFTE